MRLLIAEDDPALAKFVCRGLCSRGDEVAMAHDGETALRLFREREPDLLLLDLQLPVRDGKAVLEEVRRISPLCPVLVLSGIARTETRIACLELGADDCMAKPFAMAELRARCHAMLRRSMAHREYVERSAAAWEIAGPPQLWLGCLLLDRVGRRATLGSFPLRLTNREFALLEQLLLAGSEPVRRQQLRTAVWDEPVEANVLDVHMAALRRKLGFGVAVPAIETVRGYGYRLHLAGALEAFAG